MLRTAPLLAALLVTTGSAFACNCACSAPAAAPAQSSASEAPAQPAGHPLRGVIIDVLPAKQALLVKHEEIPGVMSAMTMLLKVDAPTLAAAKKDQAITATLVRLEDGWWLRDVAAAK
ncbi:MAG: copper-binding protein [Opitutaceae bacterium]|jgi:Cu/Ag efflux protein CusF|nr:copper-binding protein [Opitutaceae bacterium]